MKARVGWKIPRLVPAIVLLLTAGLLARPLPAASAADDPVMANIQTLWSRTDGPEARGDRGFLWGPNPLLPLIQEPMAGVPGDQRQVLYYDKSRMEVNDPNAPQDQWYVTNGLLVSEMVTGQQQIGVNPTRFAARTPAQIPFGDLDDSTGPTFASFGAHLSDPPLAAGQPVAQQIDRAGKVSTADAGGVACATVVQTTNHCIAAPFADFLNQTGTIYVNGAVTTGPLFDPPFYATGLPISEPYWITVKAAGKPTRVLLQLFERRTLTYNPANGASAQVEMGNVGLEYYHWRYDALLPTDPPSGLDPTIRTAENTLWNASPAYHYLLTNLAGGHYQIIPQDLTSQDAFGLTISDYHVVLLDNGLLGQEIHNSARVLAHESQHAYDYTASGGPTSANECYAFEIRGFLVESSAWQLWYGPGGKPNPANAFEQNANGVLSLIRNNPSQFVQRLIMAYKSECAPLGPGSPERFLTLTNLPAGIDSQLPVQQVFDALRSTINADVSSFTIDGGMAPPAPQFWGE
ncbi:MAG: hypothetical protein ACTHNK_22025 [Thermomicrobiales bacterium]